MARVRRGIIGLALGTLLLGLPAVAARAATPTVSVSDATVAEGNSGTVGAAFTISLSAPASGTVTVKYATKDGTAAAPGDYLSTSGKAKIRAGHTTATVTVPVVGDLRDEANETFRLLLKSATGATILDGSGTGQIQDDDVVGVDYWLAFPSNVPDPFNRVLLGVAGTAGTTVNVTYPGGSLPPYTFAANDAVFFPLPDSVEVNSSDVVETKGVHVTATAPVSVLGMTRGTLGGGHFSYSGEIYTALSTAELGSEHMVLAYPGIAGTPVYPSQATIAGVVDGTTATITPSISVGPHPAGVPYTVQMDQGQTYQLQSAGDLTGTIVSADHPVAVWGGAQAAQVPPGFSFADQLVEQMPPSDTWGTSFFTDPFAHPVSWTTDVVRVLAAANGTSVSINGSAVASLSAGQFYETTVTGAASITATHPVLVGQYAEGSSVTGSGDPMMVLVPPVGRLLTSYAFPYPGEFDHPYLNVIARTSDIGKVKLGGVAIPSGSFTPIGSTGYSAATVNPGGLARPTVTAPHPLEVVAYGFGQYDGLGSAAGANWRP